MKLLADRYAGRTSDTSAFITDALRQVDNPLGIVDTLLATPEIAGELCASSQAIARWRKPPSADCSRRPTRTDGLG